MIHAEHGWLIRRIFPPLKQNSDLHGAPALITIGVLRIRKHPKRVKNTISFDD